MAMTDAEKYFTALAGNTTERTALNNAIAEDIVTDAKSKGYNISTSDVETILSAKMGGGSTAMGTSIGWS